MLCTWITCLMWLAHDVTFNWASFRCTYTGVGKTRNKTKWNRKPRLVKYAYPNTRLIHGANTYPNTWLIHLRFLLRILAHLRCSCIDSNDFWSSNLDTVCFLRVSSTSWSFRQRMAEFADSTTVSGPIYLCHGMVITITPRITCMWWTV